MLTPSAVTSGVWAVAIGFVAMERRKGGGFGWVILAYAPRDKSARQPTGAAEPPRLEDVVRLSARYVHHSYTWTTVGGARYVRLYWSIRWDICRKTDEPISGEIYSVR